ncbi:MAG: DUF4177 domain-containing protein [Opitutae bacterium]|jgi:hypothetical protein|nr:DUF4177 domain-containing protein [Opitutae bacterium]MBT5750261.1 DUF4177 domain-containing protein [Flavobacteriales bacterium]
MIEVNYKEVASFEYKTITISPDGIRVKGDDISGKIADLLNITCNKYGKEQWKVISILPSMKSEGAVTKLLVTFERSLISGD